MTNPESRHSGPGFIRLEGVSKTFQEGDRKRVVLDGVVAAFAEGEIVAIVGRSGSGKSTLLNLLAGLDLPDSGTIWVGDSCVTALNDRGRTLFRRAHIGFVFQFFNLIPTLTVGENVRLTAELSGWSSAEAQKQADRMLGEVGLQDRARAYADKLSGGEQQRVAIARALCANPAAHPGRRADRQPGCGHRRAGDAAAGAPDARARQDVDHGYPFGRYRGDGRPCLPARPWPRLVVESAAPPHLDRVQQAKPPRRCRV